MSMILTTIKQEQRRIEYMLDRYQDELAKLPKGTISAKTTNGKVYHYLKYRDGKKVVSRYIKRDELDAVRDQVERRRHIETMIRSLNQEREIAEKILEGQI